MNRFYKKALAVLALLGCVALTGCSLKDKLSGTSGPKSISRPAVESAEVQFTHPAAGDTIAVFDTSAGVFKAVLFPTLAPQACDNFIGLAQAGYYNGLTVSRVENEFLVEAGQGADGKGTTIWNGSRYPIEATDRLHHYAGALCAATDASGQCASVFYVMESLPGGDSVTQELVDQMNAASYRAEVVAAYQTAGGAPYLDYTDTVFGQVYEGMDIVVGLPLNMDGTEGERAEKSRKLAKTLQIWSGLPVRMWDERQSTCEAADILSETGTFGARRKEILDSVSATVILEDYLAWRKEHPGEI